MKKLEVNFITSGHTYAVSYLVVCFATTLRNHIMLSCFCAFVHVLSHSQITDLGVSNLTTANMCNSLGLKKLEVNFIVKNGDSNFIEE